MVFLCAVPEMIGYQYYLQYQDSSLLLLYDPDKRGEGFYQDVEGIPDIITLFRVKLTKIGSKETTKFTLLARNTLN